MLLQTMQVFLKAANHASLLLPDNTNSVAQAELGEEICRGVVKKFPELKETNFLNLSDPRYSGKMEVLAGMLKILESEGAMCLHRCERANCCAICFDKWEDNPDSF